MLKIVIAQLELVIALAAENRADPQIRTLLTAAQDNLAQAIRILIGDQDPLAGDTLNQTTPPPPSA